MLIAYCSPAEGLNIIISLVLLRSLVGLGDDIPPRGDVGEDDIFMPERGDVESLVRGDVGALVRG